MKKDEEFELSLEFASGGGVEGITAYRTTVGEFDGGVELYEYIADASQDENGNLHPGKFELTDFFTLSNKEAEKLYEWLRSRFDRKGADGGR